MTAATTTIPVPFVPDVQQSVSSPLPRPQWILPFGVVFLALFLPLAYAAYTHHVWEDYLITIRHGENLVEGNGFAYHPHQPVHGFTSPLGTLLPTLFHALTGAEHGQYLPALWCFRVASALALSVACLLIYLLVRSLANSTPAATAAALLVVIDSKTIVFSASGMETAFMILFLATMLWGLFAHLTHDPDTPVLFRWHVHWPLVGFSAAALQFTRPDGVVWIVILCGLVLLFSPTPKSQLYRLIKAALLAALLYAPWLIFATIYFGSPLPTSMMAKAAALSAVGHLPPDVSMAEAAYFWVRRYGSIATGIFMPAYYQFGGWPHTTHLFASLVAVLSAAPAVLFVLAKFFRFVRVFSGLSWIVQFVPTFCVITSATYLLVTFYLTLSPGPSPWYTPQAAALGYIASASFLLRRGLFNSGLIRTSLRILFALLLGLQLYTTQAVWQQMHAQQYWVEERVRKQVGMWLADNTPPSATVFLECLGYIGYFSNRQMYDFPGLVRPQIAQTVRTHNFSLVHAAAHFSSDYLILRPHELRWLAADNPKFLERYSIVHTVDQWRQINRHASHVAGFAYLELDSTFIILQRNGTSPVSPPSPATAPVTPPSR